jgi:hypothetical protein
MFGGGLVKSRLLTQGLSINWGIISSVKILIMDEKLGT